MTLAGRGLPTEAASVASVGPFDRPLSSIDG
jgi:hypothetical protein